MAVREPNDTTDAVPLYPLTAAVHTVRARWYFRGNVAVLAIIFLAFVLVGAARVDGDRLILFGRRMPETCGSKLILGRPCIGCGLTRSLVLGVGGQWRQSRAYHPAGIWLVGWLLLQAVARTALIAIRPNRVALLYADLTASLVRLFAILYVPVVVGWL